MLKLDEIRELINLIDQSSISEFEYEHEGLKVSIKKETKGSSSAHPAGQSPIQQTSSVSVHHVEESPHLQSDTQTEPSRGQTEDERLHKIVSPMVGTFYRAPSPESEPYVKEGDHVNEDTVVCIVEAMKLMNEIEAEVKGEIVKILVENGQLVEYGQPLFLVRVE
jgi:acetyl-CoA carboxylase biotin carboxyl carrier protein